MRLTIGITTRNRPEALTACLESLTCLRRLDPEILVFDDGSEPPATAPAGIAVRFIRDAGAPGYIVGRNRLVHEARSDLVLLLDDDTRLLSEDAVVNAIGVMLADARIGAVAFAQAERDGQPWPAAMQPSRAGFRCLIPSFIGFAHLLRRDTFLALGGYRESFVYYGEEKDYCLRLIDEGYRTVYLPDALVVHAPDAAGRSRQRYLRFVSRNDCLNAFYNDPLPRVLWSLPVRFLLYFRMRHVWRIDDPWGWAWIARDVTRVARTAGFRRKPVTRATLKTWRLLRTNPERYLPPGTRA